MTRMRFFLRDHQGSTRVVLNPHSEDLEFTATMESEVSADEEEWFGNLVTRVPMVAANKNVGAPCNLHCFTMFGGKMLPHYHQKGDNYQLIPVIVSYF